MPTAVVALGEGKRVVGRLRFERDPGGAEEAARDLAVVAGSLGGARPKAIVEGDGHLWIAKFTSALDTIPVERAEIATLKLATKCGLRVAEARLELQCSDSPVALIRRFDRRGKTRIPYISARTALDQQTNESGFYTDIADVIRQISSKPVDDLNELWRRIVFTILVSNKDDHLQNHGFIYAGSDRWRLSPAFDINPSPSRQRMQSSRHFGWPTPLQIAGSRFCATKAHRRLTSGFARMLSNMRKLRKPVS